MADSFAYVLSIQNIVTENGFESEQWTTSYSGIT